MTDQPRLELHAFWRTSATYRVRVALRMKGLSWSEHQVDLIAGAQRDPAFLGVNPMGAIPALVVDGETTMTQSTAILEWLDETVPEPPLLPPDAAGRARVRSIAAMLAADTHPLITPRVRRYLQDEEGLSDDRWKEWQRHWFTAGLRGVEARLAHESGTGRFCHGDTVTIADICLASIPAVMKIFAIEVEGIPTVDRIVRRCGEMEAFAASDPYRQIGAPPAPAK